MSPSLSCLAVMLLGDDEGDVDQTQDCGFAEIGEADIAQIH